jgi:hypothetical protein
MEHVSAAAAAAAVQEGLHTGSEVKGTAFTSGQGITYSKAAHMAQE